METILDHNPTDEELKRFGGRGYFDYMLSVGYLTDPENADNNNYQIGILYANRGDFETANKYWAKIKDKQMLKVSWQDF